MNAVDRYVHDVLSHARVSQADAARIEADLRAHLNESMASGLSAEEAVARMGSAEEVARELLTTMTPSYAPVGRRLGAITVDLILIFGSTILFVLLAVYAFMNGGHALFAWEGGFPFLLMPLFGAVASMIPVAYFVFSEALTGRTLGKYLFGIVVTDEKGNKPSFGSALVRRLSLFFMPAFLIDGAIMLVSPRKQRPLETVAHTTVVSAHPAPSLALALGTSLLLAAAVAGGIWMVFSGLLFGGVDH